MGDGKRVLLEADGGDFGQIGVAAQRRQHVAFHDGRAAARLYDGRIQRLQLGLHGCGNILLAARGLAEAVESKRDAFVVRDRAEGEKLAHDCVGVGVHEVLRGAKDPRIVNAAGDDADDEA